jgi:5-methylcytosine-specific restriction endonuclease McrA
MTEDHFWELAHLSDQQLLASLQGSLRTKRRALAEVVAHLAEVEERRLHLEAACGSLFSYCVQRLGMSEDEACRRIELARLARRFPSLFPELASGRIGLSVALLLKPVLSAENQDELIPAMRGASLQQTRELLAARFPRPDVAAQIRKLPERALADLPAQPPSPPTTAPVGAAAAAPGAMHLGPQQSHLAPTRSKMVGDSPRSSRSQCIEPLSTGRYRVQFTADASLQHKLQHARDLLRHAYPGGDLSDIVSRALDLLIEDLMKRRFGARRTHSEGASPRPQSKRSSSQTDSASMSAVKLRSVVSKAPKAAPPARPHIPLASRRAVLERDGLGCSWQAEGHRCGSAAWLELDHRQPAGKGGGSQPENLRLLCRAHNRRAAEHEYGRGKIERAIASRRPSPHGSAGHA